MTDVIDYSNYGKELERILMLRTSPIAIKLLKSEDEIPDGAIQPKKDLGVHIALCQAFAMSRRQKKTIFMQKEDHWCWAPLISFGAVEFHEGHESYNEISKYIGIEDPKKAKEFVKNFPRLEYGKYAGIVSAPLITANFEPDVVLIYSNNAQLRSILWAVKYKTGAVVNSQFDPIDSCVYSILPVIENGDYRITVPDPGEYERALTSEDEIIFSVPKDKISELISGLKVVETIKLGHTQLNMEMKADYPRPEFYNNVFEMWGLEVGEVWQK
ncbi:hypothetical protein GC105_00595 [Alkalibaculum sp. M08DMB]|uniref:DUF169 domain-containing protein n=1 Tax=Alkalibaculum sporogenes TaxID=2655001 RepID=A0A6A7K575_9FIRM|nr:DUF169 domain-containing protein [Alkalibaculum sporogenes]MPW24293.1 hypothetical protein [Alkalibaculum sporogenes]